LALYSKQCGTKATHKASIGKTCQKVEILRNFPTQSDCSTISYYGSTQQSTVINFWRARIDCLSGQNMGRPSVSIGAFQAQIGFLSPTDPFTNKSNSLNIQHNS
jgi:hypothetical protein